MGRNPIEEGLRIAVVLTIVTGCEPSSSPPPPATVTTESMLTLPGIMATQFPAAASSPTPFPRGRNAVDRSQRKPEILPFTATKDIIEQIKRKHSVKIVENPTGQDIKAELEIIDYALEGIPGASFLAGGGIKIYKDKQASPQRSYGDVTSFWADNGNGLHVFLRPDFSPNSSAGVTQSGYVKNHKTELEWNVVRGFAHLFSQRFNANGTNPVLETYGEAFDVGIEHNLPYAFAQNFAASVLEPTSISFPMNQFFDNIKRGLARNPGRFTRDVKRHPERLLR